MTNLKVRGEADVGRGWQLTTQLRPLPNVYNMDIAITSNFRKSSFCKIIISLRTLNVFMTAFDSMVINVLLI